MQIRLSDHFTYGKLLRFTLPSIVMMIFTSIYGVVDGFFVSNFVGKTPFAAVNFIMPFLMVLGTPGFMLGTGGSALIAKNLGEGNKEKANSLFSLLIYTALVIGVVISVLGIIFLPQIAALLGAEGQLLTDSIRYGRIILAANPAFVLQMVFQSLMVTAEKPGLGLTFTLTAGVTNMVLDVLLVGVFPFGLEGAALATGISQVVGGVAPICYFALSRSSLLRLGKASLDLRSLVKICTNGSSELLSNLSMSLVGMLYNIQLLRFAGENGVAASGVMMYINFVFLSIFIGYSIGTAPVISYHFGAQNHGELQSLRRKSLWLISLFSVTMLLSALALATPFSKLFVCRVCPLFVRIFYRPQRRSDQRYYFLFTYTGLSDRGSYVVAADLGCGRHLVEHCRSGSNGNGSGSVFYETKPKEIPLLESIYLRRTSLGSAPYICFYSTISALLVLVVPEAPLLTPPVMTTRSPLSRPKVSVARRNAS